MNRQQEIENYNKLLIRQAQGRYLLKPEADNVEAAANELGLPQVWRWFDLKTGEWHEGRYPYKR